MIPHRFQPMLSHQGLRKHIVCLQFEDRDISLRFTIRHLKKNVTQMYVHELCLISNKCLRIVPPVNLTYLVGTSTSCRSLSMLEGHENTSFPPHRPTWSPGYRNLWFDLKSWLGHQVFDSQPDNLPWSGII